MQGHVDVGVIDGGMGEKMKGWRDGCSDGGLDM